MAQMGPLDGVRVLDLTEWISGAYATKLMADYGAEVVKIERPGGDPSRSVGPWKGGVEGPERSGTFFYFNTNKRSLVLDLKHQRAAEVFDRLLDRADIVVSSQRPGLLDQWGLGWERIHARRPEVPLIAISNFGADGPYRDYQVSDLVLYGFAGEMYTIGTLDRAPVKMFGTAALVESGAAAATACMAALTAAELQGVGQLVDLALADTQFNGVDRRHAATIGWEFAQRRSLRAPGPAAGILAGVYPCADGYVEFSGAAGRIDRLNQMLGEPEWLRDAKWWEPGVGFRADLVEEFNANFLPWLLERGKREIWEAAREAKVLSGPLFTVDELMDDAHFTDRGFWAEVADDELGAWRMPGRPVDMPKSPWSLRRPAPRLNQHHDEVLGECGYDAAEIARLIEAGATT